MTEKKISIFFCGGCNPKINRRQVAEELKHHVSGNGHVISYNNADADFVVYLSGCSVSCAERNKKAGTPFIVVAGASIDSMAMEKESLAAGIIKKGGNHFE